MTTDRLSEDLHMMQLADSFFPTGLFTASNGLEALFADRKVTGGAELLDYTRIALEYQLGPCDCVAFSGAYEAAAVSDHDEIARLDSMLCSLKTVKEAREAAIRSGKQLVRCAGEFLEHGAVLGEYGRRVSDGRATGIYPVSLAVCCHALGIQKSSALLMFLYGFVVSNVGAALRLGIIQHFEGQKIIHQLKPDMARIVQEYSDKTAADIWQFAPQSEIFQMRHEMMDAKMFVT